MSGRLARAALAAAAALLPGPAAAQLAGELEMERAGGATTARVEVLHGGAYALRAERTAGAGARTDRLGIMVPGALVSLSGYWSLFLEDRPERLGYGTNFELGRGPIALGGSVERAADAFTGAYLKLRGSDVELGLGGGRSGGDPVAHGALYAKGRRASVAVGGVAGAGRALQHLSGTWHPAVRGTAPGALFAAERSGGDDWFVEAFVTDRADFNHFAAWGPYGMDQWPHEKTIEAVGDVMRYTRPPIMNQERTTGMGIVGATHQVRSGAGETTLDARLFPVRILRRLAGGPTDGGAAAPSGRYLRDRVLPRLMLGALHGVGSGAATVLAQIGVPPFLVYAEADLRGGEPYLLIQYRMGGSP